MLTLWLTLASAQVGPPPPPTESPPAWLDRAHRQAEGLPTPYSRRVMARARLGNALIPTGFALAGASAFTAAAARGNNAGIWGTGLVLGMGSMVGGIALTADAQERAAVDLRFHHQPVRRDALVAGHVLAAVGGIGFASGVALAAGPGEDAGLFVAAGGVGLAGLSAIPYGIHAHRTRNAYLDHPGPSPIPSVSPLWDPSREAAGVALSGSF